MRTNIKIPRAIKVGGFTYPVRRDKRASDDLAAKDCWGDSRDLLKDIRLDTSSSPQQTNATFLHELLHTIDVIYLEGKLEEKTIRALAHGLHQVLEEMKVRFVL